MKKKILVLVTVLVLAFAITGCGGSSSDKDSSDTKKESTKQEEPEVKKIDKNIDAVAKELGLTGGSETMYQYIGAKAGKEYNDGEVELYEFDTASQEYKDATSKGEVSGVKIAACNDGIALVFANKKDAKIAKAFKAIVFK